MNPLRQQIGEFLAHEITPVDAIIGEHSIAEVFEEIEAILTGNDSERVLHAQGFIRDASMYKHAARDAFRNYLSHSRIWDHFREFLIAPDFYLRRTTIYSIGKLCYKERAHLLVDEFPFFLQNDPLNLPRLLFELSWLTNAIRWDFFEQIKNARHFAQRWSLCVMLDDDGQPEEDMKRVLAFLQELKADSNSFVANEAAYRFERVKVKLGPKLPKKDWRKEVKRIAGLEPQILFEPISMRFMNERTDYTILEFEQFVLGLADHK